MGTTVIAGLPTAALFYREGGSDKVYHAAVVQQGNAYGVKIAYGRRGSTLNEGMKTPEPVTLEGATKMFEKLVREKTAKGYQHSTTGGTVRVSPSPTPAPGPTVTVEAPGCLLLNPIEESEAERYLRDSGYVAQQKYDGKRLTLVKRNGGVIAFNKLGKPCGFPEPVRAAVLEYPYDVTLDCEGWTERVVVYDLLHYKTLDLRPRITLERLERLDTLRDWFDSGTVEIAETAYDSVAKKRLYARLQANGEEGIVFKDGTAPWHAGRPNSGGPFLKLKFWRSATVRVSKEPTGKHSVNMEMRDGQRWQDVGSLTIANSRALPTPGTYLEVKYLYAFPESHQLYQASELERRDDVTDADCKLSQLSYKAPTT